MSISPWLQARAVTNVNEAGTRRGSGRISPEAAGDASARASRGDDERVAKLRPNRRASPSNSPSSGPHNGYGLPHYARSKALHKSMKSTTRPHGKSQTENYSKSVVFISSFSVTTFLFFINLSVFYWYQMF